MRKVNKLREVDVLSTPQILSFCFEIRCLNGQELFLCSENRMISGFKNKYYPYSGLSLKQGNFNDSAQNEIILHGIFENKGIDKQTALVGATIKILILTGKIKNHFLTYYCTEFNKNDLDFTIKCEPESIKYNQSLLKLFSKTCRASFGDTKCKINKEDTAKQYEVAEINAQIITCVGIKEENDYFKGGTAIIDTGEAIIANYKILSHRGNNIELNGIFEDQKSIKHLTLIAGCDKKFRTCCKKFNNAVNFRGEPVIPEYNFLRN